MPSRIAAATSVHRPFRSRDWGDTSLNSQKKYASTITEKLNSSGRRKTLYTGRTDAPRKALVTAAAAAGVDVKSLAVKSTSLDDVFVHYTGHDLRDALQDPAPRQLAIRR